MEQVICSTGEIVYVDSVDFERVSSHKWRFQEGYAVANVNNKLVYMQYLVMGASPIGGWHLHHKDGDKLNNTKRNLHLISHSAHSRKHMKNRSASFYKWCEENKIRLSKKTIKMAYNLYREKVQ